MSGYDVIIVGAGISGLCCGAILSKNGQKVLVLEKRPVVGGRIAEFNMDGYTIQWGGHILEDTGSGLGKIFDYVGLTLEDTGTRNNACPVYYDGTWRDIRDFYKDDKEEYRRIVEEIVNSSYKDFDKLDDVPLRTWLKERTDNEGVINFMESLAKIESMGGHEDRWWNISASDFLFTRKLHYGEKRVAGYSVWPLGGYEKICTDLAGVISENGGAIETGVDVSNIRIENEQVRGLELGRHKLPEHYFDDGDRNALYADNVICTIPIWNALKVLPEDKIPQWYTDQIKEGAKLENRTFWFGFYAALEEPVYVRSPLELTGWVNGPYTGLDGWSFLPSSLDPSIAPEGKHLLCCGVVADATLYQDKELLNEKFDELDQEMDQLFPTLKEHVIWKHRHTVLTYNIWQRPGLVGMFRPRNKVPAVEGLWLAGDTYRSRMIGIDRSARSAMTVSEEILGKRLAEFENSWHY